MAAKEVTGAWPVKAAPPIPAWAMLPGRLTTGAGAGGGVTEVPVLKLLFEILLFTGDI